MPKEKKIIDKTHLAFAVLLLTLVLTDTQRFGNIPLLTMFLIFLIYPKIRLGKFGKMELGLFLYSVYISIVTLLNIKTQLSGYEANSFLLLIEYFLCIFLAFILSSNVDILIFLKDIGFVGGMLSVFGIVEGVLRFPIYHYLLSGKLNIPDIGTNDYRIVIIFAYPIICGGFLIMFLICKLFFPIKNNLLNILLLVSIIEAILMNKSRSSWLAIAFLLILYLIKYTKFNLKINKKVVIYTIFIFFVLFFLKIIFNVDVVSNIASEIIDRFSGSLNAGEGQIIRIETVQNSFIYWKDNIRILLFGGGKNYDKVFLQMYPVIKGGGSFVWNGAIDNEYITIIHESGLVGLAFILFVFFTAIKRFITCDKCDKSSVCVNMAVIGWATVIYFYEGFNYPFIFLTIAILCSLSDRCVEKEQQKNEIN
ncbi:O-antigen ligase [uncultured Limosilactobacillus sp.]|uniref:O-antigen ligase family protein n=1 Tax=uncultured Limosilactobacillus sp. TaxID=2837629 RepID=UPI00259A1155|nr:O-antigen ligase family protein [uncultured Limosilactobacillus sp.]